MRQPIVADDGGISRKRQTTCSIEAILRFLKNKGYAAMTSNDAGLFICNYVYYQSLRFAEQKGHKSLFVHVPLFSTINEETDAIRRISLGGHCIDLLNIKRFK
ncbi:hypothetical protein E1A91_D02G190700v1 [Gossypium mustelinum]|uniref:Pyrrolidone-carboxylate peptidase n=1 Tax=Gossypium mustelinum TaxID=34275 RepID=A0A5D2VYM0_GOSMU|nr:hypothetical protein E1A91_D02G190700v1 [Gossypium mustelinum]TYI94257.1 hypothetical protein E1A91_D02G190700v1 [Gossypium mustelinum]